jgi:hypothetical protein
LDFKAKSGNPTLGVERDVNSNLGAAQAADAMGATKTVMRTGIEQTALGQVARQF